MEFRSLPRFPLAALPTPLESLDRLSRHLGGPKILIKRDDLTGLALGGNKTRKLEYLVGEAIARRADTLLTAGAAQSNHCRQTAAAAARAGIHCVLVLGGSPPDVLSGNLLLDSILGASVHWAGDDRKGERLEEVAADLESRGRRPFVIPYGGSNPLGAVAYAGAMAELIEQLNAVRMMVDAIVVASSSGGTQAGLIAGAIMHDFLGTVIGVRIDKQERSDGPYADLVHALACQTLSLAGAGSAVPREMVRISEEYLGGGYGVVGPMERDAIRLCARTEGILLDPVYTARAMGGLIDMITQKHFQSGDTVLFWHTGGAPSLFAYAHDLS